MLSPQPTVTRLAEARLGGGGLIVDASPVGVRLRLSQHATHVSPGAPTVMALKHSLGQGELEVRAEFGERGLALTLVLNDRFGTTALRTAESGATVAFEGEAIRLRLALSGSDCLYGLGGFGENLNRNPGRYECWNTDDPHHQDRKTPYCTIPFLLRLSPDGAMPCGIFVENAGRVFFDLGVGEAGVARIDCATGDLVLWLIAGETPAEVLKGWAELSGRMDRPPMWALGYQQCRWSYYPESRVRELAGQFRARRIPCDTLYLDIHYMDGYRVFTWHPERFPDPQGLLSDLREEGFRVVSIVDPGVKIDKGYRPYEEGLRTPGFFLRRSSGDLVDEEVWPGKTHFPDFGAPGVDATWGDWQHEALTAKGIAGIWNDMNEPAVFNNRRFPDDAIHYDDARWSAHRTCHNLYGLRMARASRAGLLRHAADERPFVLTRSGWAGIQQHSAVWTGDNRSAFNCMRTDLVMLLSMGVSGVPFTGCDIGGFFNDGYGELFARWIEWGVLQPMCRAHSCDGTVDQEPWSFGPEVERVARRAIELRMQLLPYLYTAFVEASESGLPVMRPLFLEYPGDASVLNIADQFLVGRDLMAAPIIEQGKERRAVYLPAGEWVHFWSGERLSGGRWILAEGRFGQVPLYVRAGAAIPMHPVRQHTGEAVSTLYFEIFPAERIVGGVVEDDGRSFAYRDEDECIRLVRGTATAGVVEFELTAPQGRYRPERPTITFRVQRQGRSVARVTVNGADAAYAEEGPVVVFEVADSGQALSCRVAFSD